MGNAQDGLDAPGLREENERLRRELAEARRYKDILDRLPQTVGIADREGKLVYTSFSGYSAFGYGPEDVERGLHISQLIVPEEGSRAREDMARLAERRLPFADEFTALRKDGSTFPVLIYSLPLESEGSFDGIISIILDLSRQKESERKLLDSQEELKRAQALLRAAIEQSAAGIMIALARDCQMLMVNEAAGEILGQERELSLTISDRDRIAQTWKLLEPDGRILADGERPLELIVRRGDSFLNEELVVRRRDGSERLVILNGGPVHDETGEIIAGIVVFADITGMKRAERDLQKVANLESLGILAGGIAHDFNNILTVLLGNLSLLRLDVPAGDPRLSLLDDMGLAISRAERLTFQLLTFAKGGAPIKEAASLGEIVRDSASFVLRGSAVGCEYSIPEGLWPAEFDKGQISQVVQNLVLNAVQAMPSGGAMEIEAANAEIGEGEVPGLSPGRYLRISVRDRGPGIPRALLQRIFDPYFSTKEGGSGLGLAIAYSIMRKHGGSIGAESAEGRGSTFTIHLPASPGKAAPRRRPEARLVRSEGLVLVMDDEPGLRSVLCRFLQRLGLRTVAAADGEEALREYKRARAEGGEFLCAVLDLTIPGGMGGLETFRALRELEPGIKAIVCSGYSQDTIMSEHAELGFAGVLKKPFDLSQLSRMIGDLGGGGSGS